MHAGIFPAISKFSKKGFFGKLVLTFCIYNAIDGGIAARRKYGAPIVRKIAALKPAGIFCFNWPVTFMNGWRMSFAKSMLLSWLAALLLLLENFRGLYYLPAYGPIKRIFVPCPIYATL